MISADNELFPIFEIWLDIKVFVDFKDYLTMLFNQKQCYQDMVYLG